MAVARGGLTARFESMLHPLWQAGQELGAMPFPHGKQLARGTAVHRIAA